MATAHSIIAAFQRLRQKDQEYEFNQEHRRPYLKIEKQKGLETALSSLFETRCGSTRVALDPALAMYMFFLRRQLWGIY